MCNITDTTNLIEVHNQQGLVKLLELYEDFKLSEMTIGQITDDYYESLLTMDLTKVLSSPVSESSTEIDSETDFDDYIGDGAIDTSYRNVSVVQLSLNKDQHFVITTEGGLGHQNDIVLNKTQLKEFIRALETFVQKAEDLGF